ncbi:hypothetical protein [Kaistella pullorum]|uniref:Uncharacterized protein n=1 Tax=Kaistella pullorum TaxID=2763074 RepID=A0ABR8WP44_9FLAO|nr:hypothetical protein [Kaistella pullorum]MBD8018854.1 hypothetical protein [Kaistella pullorum]
MSHLDILHFEQLKKEVESRYLENHSPSFEEISKWKGIDIIYFQEDLRKIAKGNISEKTFYTYFKTSPVTKLPRIDMLNLLSVYAGYASWYDFKKNHLFADEVLQEREEAVENSSTGDLIPEASSDSRIAQTNEEKRLPTSSSETDENDILQKSNTDNQVIKQNTSSLETYDTQDSKSAFTVIKKYVWLGISVLLAVAVGLLIFKDELFSKKYYYSFIDADRNSKINAELQVQILKENESPILYSAKPNEPFVYTTKSKDLTMVVSSPYYRTDTIQRNLETAPEAENIELKPNDYAIMLFYYSKSITDLKKKRVSLNYLISDNALIYQVFDNQFYGVETMDKQRYINLVTLPSTSLENLEVIDTQTNQSGKIVMIKFKIGTNEENK